MLKRQCSSDSAARRMPWWFFTIVSVIALTCVSCSDAVKLPSHSRQVTVQPPHTTDDARMPLTDSAPAQGDMTPTVSISPPQSMLVRPTPTPTPVVLQTTTIDDSIQGTDINQFNYVGNDWRHSLSECPGQNCYGTLPYNGSNSWDSTTDDYVTISFTGVQIKLYAVLDPAHGIGAISIDGGNENKVDFYANTRNGNQLLWTSPILSAGTHTFKLRVTGDKNPNSSGTPVVPDRVDILG